MKKIERINTNNKTIKILACLLRDGFSHLECSASLMFVEAKSKIEKPLQSHTKPFTYCMLCFTELYNHLGVKILKMVAATKSDDKGF